MSKKFQYVCQPMSPHPPALCVGGPKDGVYVEVDWIERGDELLEPWKSSYTYDKATHTMRYIAAIDTARTPKA